MKNFLKKEIIITIYLKYQLSCKLLSKELKIETTSLSRMIKPQTVDFPNTIIPNRRSPDYVPMDFTKSLGPGPGIHPLGAREQESFIRDSRSRDDDIVGIMTIGISAFGKKHGAFYFYRKITFFLTTYYTARLSK